MLHVGYGSVADIGAALAKVRFVAYIGVSREGN